MLDSASELLSEGPTPSALNAACSKSHADFLAAALPFVARPVLGWGGERLGVTC